tara:strand:+ start:164 stop:400 length:237 start_codon:yes stop_codon:yes gene_type:complete
MEKFYLDNKVKKMRRLTDLTDSQFLNVQNSLQSKQKNSIREHQDDTKDAERERLKERFAEKAKTKNNNLWDMVTGLFK